MDDALFDKSEIFDGNNQCTFLLAIFPAIIGRKGGDSMKKITQQLSFFDKDNL